ncbi:unnamed protein product [Rotaria sp. Silwood2]|nr:unnamed protein product [Rotaria sp. Silwood2]
MYQLLNIVQVGFYIYLKFNILKHFFSFIDDDINLKIKPKGIFYDFINTNMKSLFNNDNQFHRQSNITIVKDQSLINQYEDNPRSYACLSTLNSVWIISLVLNTLMFI